MQELADIIHESDEISQKVKDRVPKGTPGSRLTGKIFTSDSSKAVKLLGVDLKDPQESLLITIGALIAQLAEIESRESRL